MRSRHYRRTTMRKITLLLVFFLVAPGCDRKSKQERIHEFNEERVRALIDDIEAQEKPDEITITISQLQVQLLGVKTKGLKFSVLGHKKQPDGTIKHIRPRLPEKFEPKQDNTRLWIISGMLGLFVVVVAVGVATESWNSLW